MWLTWSGGCCCLVAVFVAAKRAAEICELEVSRIGGRRDGIAELADQQIYVPNTLLVVVAVSCDPETFARDARVLADGGYDLDRVCAVDQFRYTAHIEIVGVFRNSA